MDLYEQNKRYLDEYYDYVKLNEEEIFEDDDEDIIVFQEKNIDGRNNFLLEKEGYNWRFDSIYEPEEAARCWCNRFKNVTYRTVFIIIGIGTGEQIKALNERYPDNYKIVCEPSQKLFLHLLKIRDIRNILNFKKGIQIIQIF